MRERKKWYTYKERREKTMATGTNLLCIGGITVFYTTSEFVSLDWSIICHANSDIKPIPRSTQVELICRKLVLFKYKRSSLCISDHSIGIYFQSVNMITFNLCENSILGTSILVSEGTHQLTISILTTRHVKQGGHWHIAMVAWSSTLYRCRVRRTLIVLTTSINLIRVVNV